MKILLIDFTEKSRYATMLQNILESSASLTVSMKKESLNSWPAQSCEERYRVILTGEKPDIVVLLLGSRTSDKHDSIIRSLWKQSMKIPVIVFFESENSFDALALKLKDGTVEFVIGPPSARNILPIVWGMVSDVSYDS